MSTTGPVETREGIVVTVSVSLEDEGCMATLRFVGRRAEDVVDLRRIDVRVPRGGNVTDEMLRNVPISSARKRASRVFHKAGYETLAESAYDTPRSGRPINLDRYHDFAEAYVDEAANGPVGIYERIIKNHPKFHGYRRKKLEDMLTEARRHGFIKPHPQRQLDEPWYEYEKLRRSRGESQ